MLMDKTTSSNEINFNLWFGGQNRVAVKRLHCNAKDVGSYPIATRYEIGTFGGSK